MSFAAIGAASADVFARRGWNEQEWAAARERLRARGLLNAHHTATDACRALRAKVERRTDELAAARWQTLGDKDTTKLAELLGRPWLEVLDPGMLPRETTLGIGRTG